MRLPKPKVLPPVQPNPGIDAAYRRKLLALLKEMHDDVQAIIKRAYETNQPAIKEIAEDAGPADALAAAIKKLVKDWLGRFDLAAVELARYFSQSVSDRSDAALRSILEKAGIAVPFVMTATQQDIISAIVHENVSLIRSIASRYLGDVEGSVMRSVQVGRDISGLAQELEEHYGVSTRRARFIARDQNNKATAFLNRGRQIEFGITTAIWKHSHAGKQPRPTHVANDGKEFDVRTGWYDPHEKKWIQPGELPNCRCMAKSIIPGFI